MNKYRKVSDQVTTQSKPVTLTTAQSMSTAQSISSSTLGGWRVETVRFNVVEHLATQVILGCDYFDKHIESIHPRQRIVELADGTIVLIIRKPSPRAWDAIPLSEEQAYEPAHQLTGSKISVLEPTTLEPESTNLVMVSLQRYVLITVETHLGLCRKHQCLTTAGIHHVNPGQPFKVLIANFTKNPVKLNALQFVDTDNHHLDIIT